jgi:shikimate dehydrogenase
VPALDDMAENDPMSTFAQRPSLLCGLIGRNIQRSRMPQLHMREADAQDIRCVYRLIDLAVLNLTVEALPDLVAAAECLGFDGLNMTHPCKQAIVPHLTRLSEDAAMLGAVNTVLLRNAERVGHNTDWMGFAQAFRRNMRGAPLDRVVQLGAGGAGSAVGYAALTLGVEELTIFDLDARRAEQVAARLTQRFGAGRARVGTDLPTDVATATGLINTTPVGMELHPGMPLPASLIHPNLWVAEVIYFPLETELLKCARARRCKTLDGSGMAIFQAAEAFRLFSGQEPDIDRMTQSFMSMSE